MKVILPMLDSIIVEHGEGFPAKLAVAMSVSEQTIRNWRNGRPLNLSMARQLARTLKVSLETLMDNPKGRS